MAENSDHPETCVAENSAQSYTSEPSLSQSGANPKTSTPVSGNLLSHTSFLSKVLAGQAPAVKYPARVEGPSSKVVGQGY